ncbi:unnamed protein product, partial [Closterium sp. NIES-53]
DHFLSVCPTTLTVDLLEQRLLAGETSTVAVGASHGDPRTPVFEGCSPSPLLPSVASAAAADLGGFESVGAESAPSGRRRPGRGEGGKGTGGTGGAVEVVVVAVEGVGVVVGVVAGVEVSAAAVEAEEAVAVAEGAEVAEAAEAAVELVAALRRVAPVAVSASSNNAVMRPCPPSSFMSGTLGVSEVGGDCYLCLPPDPGGEAAALGACEAATLGASVSAAPGAGESALSGTASAQVFHTFTLCSGASRSFFRDRTTLTPLSRPVAVSLADPSGSPVLASFSAVLPCPAAPSGTLSGLYLPSFSTNLVSGADLQDQGVDQFTPTSQRVTHYTCARTGRHLATFTRRPGSSLYTLSTESPPVPASGQVAASSQVFAAVSGSGPESAPCSCRLLSHQTLLWHHRLGHPSLPHLRGMASRVLVSGLPRSLPPLPPGPAPTCVPCVEGRQRAAPHSSEFPPTEAPLQTLHMDVWGPARVHGQGHERYFLLVVDDYSRYTTVFSLRSKGDVTEVLIDWIRAARLQLRESFGSDFPVLRLHSDRGREFSSARLGAFCRAQGIRQTFTLPASPQQNGIAERRIGMVMEVARSSMIHAAAPHFLWPFAVQYAAHQLNLQPRVSLPETSPTLRWTGKVGDASAFRVWGSRAFVRDLSADKLSPRAVPCVFLGFPPDAPGWQFYHPTSRRVLSSQDITFDESVPYYRLFPYRTAPLPPPPLFLAPGPPPVDPLPPQGPAPSGVSQVDAVVFVEVAVDSGAARGAEPVGAGSGGTESGGAEPGGAESGGAEPGVAELGGAESWGAEPGVAESGVAEPGGTEPGGAESARVASRRASSRRELLSPQELREWFARCWSRAAGAGGSPVAPGPGGARTCGTGDVGTGGAPAATGVGPAGASGAADAGAAGGVVGPAGGTAEAAGGTGAAGTGAARVGSVGAEGAASTGAATGGTGAVPVGTGSPARPRPYFVPLLEQVLGLPPSPGPAPPLECPQPVQSQSPLPPVSPLPAPSPYAGPTGGLAERREHASRPSSPVRSTRTSRRAPRPRPPAGPGTHQMTLRPSTAPLRVPLPSPPESSLPVVADPESDSLRAASPTVARLLSTVVTDPSFESIAASALVAELEEFQCFSAALPHLVSTLIAPEGDPDAPDIPTPRSYAEAIESPYSSQWQSAMDAEMASWKSTGTYVDNVPPPGANIVSGMWIFRVKRPPGSPPVFKARYVARGFSQRQGVDYFQTFSPTPKMTSLRVLLHVAAQRDYELHSLDFTTAFLQGSLHEEIWLRRPPGFTGSFHPGTQWSLRRPVYGLRQAPHEWHDTLRTTLAALGFAPSTAHPSLFLRTDTSLPPFYILVYITRDRAQRTITLTQSHMVQQVLQRFDFTYSSPQATPLCTRHSLSALPSDESVEPSGPYPELVGCLITSGLGLVLGGRHPVVLIGHADASWADDQATQRSSQGYTFSLGSGSVSWRSTRSSSVLGSSCEAEIYAGAMAAQELRWLTYLLTYLGEPPCSPPVLYVDNKAMLALCREHRLEHRTKHIALRYFLACELQQRGQLRLAYLASEANTADIFTKALPPGDHQRFCTMLGLAPGPRPPAPGPLATPTAAPVATATAATAPAATAAPACCATMALLRVLAFDHEGRPVQFDTWLDDLQLYLLSDSKESVSLFDLASGATTAPPATADSATCSPALYDAVVARYSSPATDALGRLLLPYLFPELSAFATVEDLVFHLRTSDARYRATVPAEFLDRNQPPMFITLYFIVTRLPDSLRSVRDHFLSLDPNSLTVDLLDQHLLAAETSAVAVGAAHGTPRPPFFEVCSPSPLAPSYASAAAADVSVAEDVGAASASAKRRSSKGKGGRGGGGGSGGGGGGNDSGGGDSSGGGGTIGGSGGSGGGGGGSGGSGGSGGGGTGGGRTGPWREGPGGGQRQQHDSYPYDIRMGDRAGQTCGKLHTQHRCFSCLDDAWRAEFGDEVERPRWSDLVRSVVAIFDLDFDVILSAMYAFSSGDEGDCYWCVPPDPGIAAAALGASESVQLTFRSSPPLVLYELGSSLYTLATEPPQVAASAQVSASGQVAASCSCRLLSHQTLLWHHRLGHPSLPRLRGMHSRLLVCGLPMSLPPLPPSPALPFLPCVDGRQCATPHSSFPPTTSPLHTLHMDVWGPARVSGQGCERYFWLVVDDYTRYTTVFPLRNKGQDLPVLCLHSGRAGEFSSNLLRDFCRGEGILRSFTLPDSPQKNGIAERRIGFVIEVARTSMIHAAAPHFLWSFAVWYGAHQLNLQPLLSLPETSSTLRWTGEVGDASVFRVWGSRAFVRDTSADKLSARAIPCVFLGFVLDALGWKFYHPTSRRVLPSQDVTFDESGPAPSGVSHVHPLPGTAPVEVAVGSGVARGAAFGGAEPGVAESEGAGSGSAEPGGEEPGGAEPRGVELGGAESEGAESGGAEPWGAASSGGPAGASPRLSPQQLPGGARATAGAGGTGGTAAAGPGGARTRGAGAAGTGGVGGAGAGDPTEPGAAGAGGSCARGAGVGGPGAGGTEGARAEAIDPGAGGAGGTVLPRPYFFPLLQQRREPASRLVLPVRTTHRVPRSRPPPVPRTHSMALRPSSVPLCVPLPAPPESSLPEVPDPSSYCARAANPTVAHLLATAVTDPSFDSAAASALVAQLLDFAAACRLDYATALVAESEFASPPSVGGECALGTNVLQDRQEDFECLAAAVPCFASMLLAPEGDPDAPDIPTLRSYAEASTGPYSSQWQAAMDAEMASWKSTGTYVDAIPPSRANIVDGMWIFMVNRPPGSPPAFKARYVARGFSQRQGVDYFQTFSPTPKMTTLWVLLHVAAQCDYELHSLDFSTDFLQGSLHEEIWLRRPPGFTGSFPARTQWSLQRPIYSLPRAPREWHDTLRTTLAALGFTPSTADPSLFLRTDTSLSPFYVLVYINDLVFVTAYTEALTLVLQRFGFQFSSPQPTPLPIGHSLSALPSDESVEPSGLYPELVGCLMYLMTCTRPDLAYPLSLLALYVAPVRQAWGSCLEDGVQLSSQVTQTLRGFDDSATQRSSQGYTFSLGSGSVSWRSTRSSSVLSSSCEVEIYAMAMVALELCWLTYLLTDLGEQPRSPPILYVDNKAMIALCQEHRLEHRTKHIAMRYFLARELQQHGQLCLAYVATRANTVDVFTKALSCGDHQRGATVLGLVPTLPHLLTA